MFQSLLSDIHFSAIFPLKNEWGGKKVKISLPALRSHIGGRRIAPVILYLGGRWRWVVSYTLRPLYPWWRTLVPIVLFWIFHDLFRYNYYRLACSLLIRWTFLRKGVEQHFPHSRTQCQRICLFAVQYIRNYLFIICEYIVVCSALRPREPVTISRISRKKKEETWAGKRVSKKAL